MHNIGLRRKQVSGSISTKIKTEGPKADNIRTFQSEHN